MNTQLSQQGFKIGSRVLDENELRVLLPSYDNIINQIEKFREEAKNISEVSSNTQMDFEEKFDLKKDYNNIFSILGGRGTGKTSAAVTVRHRIINDNRRDNADIIMPLIVPDHMGEISDAFGWIITCLGEKIDILKRDYLKFIKDQYNERIYGNKYTELFDKYCRKEQKLELDIIYRKVYKEYYFRKEIYQRILAQEYVGKNEYVDETKESLEADQNLIKDFFRLIEEIIHIKSKLNDNKEPLIYFFFDDVDISAKRGPDVLSTTMRYLTHPNIVTFICGDYKVFSEMLTIDFLQKENLLDLGLMDKIYTSHNEKEFEEHTRGTENTALNLRKVRGYDYLKKMLPSALRYEMPKLSNESKAKFRYTKNNVLVDDDLNTSKNNNEIKTNKELTLLELLEKNFYTDDELNNGKSFLKYKGTEVYSYFLIFDSTPRGLINPYYFLYQMLQDKKAEINVWTSSDIKQFLDIIVSSSLILGDYKELINRIIRIDVKAEDKQYKVNNEQKEYNKIEYYIDYSYLDSVFDEVINEKDDCVSEKIEDFILLFILAHFFENILVVVNNKRNILNTNLHGDRLLCKILNSANIKGNLYPQISEVNRLLYIYYLLSENISKINSAKIFSNGEQIYFVWKYYNVLKILSLHECDNDTSKTGRDLLYNLFENIFTQDRDWVKKKITQMFDLGKTNKKIFLDAKNGFKNKYINLEINKDEILNSKQLEKFVVDIDNKPLVNLRAKNWNRKEIDYIDKLEGMLNYIKKKNIIDNKFNNNYEELLETLEEIFIFKKHEEELVKIFNNYKTQLNDYDEEINSIEKKFNNSINEIIYNRSNIYSRMKDLESLAKINNTQFIIDDVGKDIQYIPFYDDNAAMIYKISELDDDGNQLEYIPIFDAQKNACRYGIDLSDRFLITPIGMLLVNRDNKVLQSKKNIELVKLYYRNKEELRLLKNYIEPQITNNSPNYENVINTQNDLMKKLEILENDIEDVRMSAENLINSLKISVDFTEKIIDISKLERFIKDINLCLIKREVTRIFNYTTLKNDKNNSKDVAKNLINIYEDIIEASYEVIINQAEEFYAIISDEVIHTLKDLLEKYNTGMINEKINEFLSYGNYVNQEVIDGFIRYLRSVVMRKPNRMIHPEDRDEIKMLLKQLSNLESIKRQESNGEDNIFETKNAYAHIDFILEDYIKLITLLDIIKVESSSALKKLRDEVFNLIGSNAVSTTSKFSSYKRFIDSLQQ